MVNFVIVLEYLSICLTFVALILLLNGDGAREQKLLIFIMYGSLVQNVGYLLELIAPTVEAAVAAVTVENVGPPVLLLVYLHLLLRRPPEKAAAGAGGHQLFDSAHGVLQLERPVLPAV